MKQIVRRMSAVTLLIIAVAGLVFLRSVRVAQLSAEPTVAQVPLAVTIATVRSGTLTETVDEFAKISAQTETTIASQIMARCISIDKREGDVVQAGEIVARLDAAELQHNADASFNQYLAGRASAVAAGSLVQQAKADYTARLSDLRSALSAVAAQNAEAAAAQQNVFGARAQVEALRAALASAQVASVTQEERTARDKILYSNQAISLEQYEASQAATAQAQSVVKALGSQIESAKSAVIAAESRVTAMEQGVAGARAKVSAATAAIAAAQSRIVSQAKSKQAANEQATALANSSRSADARVGYASLHAPFDGIVTARLVEPGDLVGPGQPILKVLKPGNVKVTVAVPQELSGAIRSGNSLTLIANGNQRTVSVSRLYPALSPAHQLILEADLSIPPFGLHSGSTLLARLHLRSARGIVIPSSSVLRGENGTTVFCVRAHKLKLVPVKVIVHQGSESLITGALKVGEAVVVGQQAQLMTMYSGEPVSIAADKYSNANN